MSPIFNNLTVLTRKTKVPVPYRFYQKSLCMSRLSSLLFISWMSQLYVLRHVVIRVASHIRFRQVSLTTQHER